MKDQDQKLVLALKGTDNFKHLEKDDFVISLRAFEGGIERSSQSGCVSPAYTVLRSKGEVSPGFAARLLKTPEFISQISMTYDGIREGKAIKFKDAGPVPLPVPPTAEQSAITSFIDGVVFKMDSAIASQERMIELLKERRSAIITQAVTKGLDPKAKMKDSGLPWLGQAPAHWEMKKLIHVAHEAGVKNTGMVEDNLLSLSYGRIIRKDIDTNEGLLPASFEGYQIVEEGDTVLRLTDLQNDQRSLRAGFVNERGIITSAYCVVRPTGISNRWLFNALRAADLLKVYYSMGGGVRQSLDFESIKRILIPVPPRAEQLAIDAYLVAEEERIRSAISSQERMIELLKERRSAIITQAVTGQIDVR
jgi:type I restriction enzyme S subunit